LSFKKYVEISLKEHLMEQKKRRKSKEPKRRMKKIVRARHSPPNEV